EPAFVYRHQWRPGDVLMSDNCMVQHRAIQDYDMPQRRLMHRTTMGGAVPAQRSRAQSLCSSCDFASRTTPCTDQAHIGYDPPMDQRPGGGTRAVPTIREERDE